MSVVVVMVRYGHVGDAITIEVSKRYKLRLATHRARSHRAISRLRKRSISVAQKDRHRVVGCILAG